MKLALAGDTMLGRSVAGAISELRALPDLVSEHVIEAVREADLFLLNLECCVSERGELWPDPRKPFFFRAPPRAVELLAELGVDCVTLANNHALDYGRAALLDTFEHLERAGIAYVGAGADEVRARAPVLLEAAGFRLGVVALTDHPRDYAAGPGEAGVAYGNLGREPAPAWVRDALAAMSADAKLVTPHWGPNMTRRPVAHVRAAAAALVEAGATLVAGHSAHVFHGIAGAVLYDLGDFLDDYRVDPLLRNDLGLLWLVDLERDGPRRLEAMPLKLDYCHTRVADGDDRLWIAHRLRGACAELGTDVREEAGRLVVDWR
jgi:poly-gamma-glutamate capsule biosynthesis protein CapA/YwtB (metallophosphatase superfamily)